MDAGERDARIQIERLIGGKDDYGGKTPDWAFYAEAWAKVIYGNGQERRIAAQDAASVSATFRVPYSRKLAAVTEADRIQFGGVWDINSAIVRGHRDAIEFTAVKAK